MSFKTKLSTLFVAFAAAATSRAVAEVTDAELCLGECNEDETECTFHMGINIFAGETGYYEVRGCAGVQPTLGMKFGVKYTFDQSNVTNWFHPVGFAYGPDGVYGLNVELEPVSADPVSSVVCTEDNYCQHPQYMLNGEKLCTDCSDPEDFGLDEYEGVYFHGGRDDWIDAGNFSIELTITDPATTELFYFCHIHNKMSARIKVLDENGRQKNPKDLTAIPYEYHSPSEFDRRCGTFNASQFRPDGETCKGMTFVCGDDKEYLYGQCLNAIDCAMHVAMRTPFIGKDPTTTFMHQMIPHHQNAVNMAKLLLKYNPPSLRCGTAYDGRRRLASALSPLRADDDDGGFGDDGGFDEDFCHDGNEDGGTPAETLLWEIINGQNAQITFMRAWLADNLQPSDDYCKAEPFFPSEAIVALTGLSVVTACSLIATGYFAYNRKNIATAKTEEVTEKEVAEEVKGLVSVEAPETKA